MASSRFALLTRHFSRRFLDNDLISPNGDAHVGLSQAVAAFIAPGLVVASVVLFKYARWHASWQQVLDLSVADALLYVSLSMIALGLAATITWDAFFLDARDRYNLGVLPIPGRLLTAAKLGALALFLAVLTGAVNLVEVVLIPSIMLQAVSTGVFFQHFLPLTLAQAVAPALAGAWTALAVVALRGLLVLLLPARMSARLAPIVQGALVLGFLAWTMSLSPFLDRSYEVLPRGGWLRDASPPMWFLGLYEAMIANPAPYYVPLANKAVGALGVTTLLVVLAFVLPAARPPGEGVGDSTAGVSRGWMARLHRLVARGLIRDQLGRGCFGFTLTTLGRSGTHRLYLAGAVGAGLAWAATGVFWLYAGQGLTGLRTPSTTMLQVQPILILLIAAALRFGVLVPTSLPANWLFRVTEQKATSRYGAGPRRAVLMVTLVPVAALLPVCVGLWGWRAAGYHALAGVLYAQLIVESFFGGLAVVPFTAPYVSGRLKLKSRIAFYVTGGVLVTALPSEIEALSYRGAVAPWAFLLALAVLAVVSALVRRRKQQRLTGLVFDEIDDDSVQTLGLVQ